MGALIFAAIFIVCGLYLLVTGELPLQTGYSIKIEALTSETGARVIGGLLVAGGLYLIHEFRN